MQPQWQLMQPQLLSAAATGGGYLASETNSCCGYCVRASSNRWDLCKMARELDDRGSRTCAEWSLVTVSCQLHPCSTCMLFCRGRCTSGRDPCCTTWLVCGPEPHRQRLTLAQCSELLHTCKCCSPFPLWLAISSAVVGCPYMHLLLPAGVACRCADLC